MTRGWIGGVWPQEATTGEDRAAQKSPAPSWDLELVMLAIDVLHKKWTLKLLHALSQRDLRYHQLRDGLHIQAKVLSESLRSMERDGVVARVIGRGLPSPIVYSLTPLGQSLGPVLKAMEEWALDHATEVRACRSAADEQPPPWSPPVTPR